MTARLLALLLLSGVLAAAGRVRARPPRPAVVSASAYGISVILPGQPGAGAASVSAPAGAATGAADGFAYPADGRRREREPRPPALRRAARRRQAVTDVLAISLLNGEITADSVAGRAKASAAGADVDGSHVTNLVVLGQPVAPTANGRFPLGDWGYAVTLEQVASRPSRTDTRNARAAVTALRVVLTADHGGLPAGAEILVGHAEAAAATAVAPVAPPGGTNPTKPAQKPGRPAGVPPKKPKPLPKPPEAEPAGRARSSGPRPPTSRRRSRPPATSSRSTARRRSPTRSERARAGVGWHHGEDIFAPLGAPLLAVADGTIFSVGWNDRGGYRLWLRDRQGNQFYYAHLSAFSPLAVDGNEVKAGDVIGFVGNTGDAQSTPYHLHFEIHPVGLLPIGYDGVVNAVPVPERLAAAPGRLLCGRPRLGAAGAGDGDRAAAGGRPARLDRHLERERPRAGLARAGAHRPGLGRGRRRAAPERVASYEFDRSGRTAACTCSRPTPRR